MTEHNVDFNALGEKMHAWATTLFPICRSLTGKGVRETLRFFREVVPDLAIHEIPSGTDVFDWTIPKEWAVKDAYIADSSGNRIVDFNKSNLHLVGYSAPVDKILTLEELKPNLYSIPDMPDAIPYITSYYKERWGFCLTHNEREKLTPGNYHVKIDTELFDGSLTYADYVLPGESEKEILISSYICHPSLANNELSGPIVAVALLKLLSQFPNRRYTYRFVFVPETIGAIAYLSKHFIKMKSHTIAGYVLTCIGDERNHTYLQSREENTLADRAAIHVMSNRYSDYRLYSFLERGSDERQYCAPGIDLPVGSIMRTKYGDYPEYHTSLDDLSLVTAKGLQGGLESVFDTLMLLENNFTYKVTTLCEPQLGKRGLYPTLSNMFMDYSDVKVMTDLIAYSDGTRDLIAIADKIKVDASKLFPIVSKLEREGLLTKVDI